MSACRVYEGLDSKRIVAQNSEAKDDTCFKCQQKGQYHGKCILSDATATGDMVKMVEVKEDVALLIIWCFYV